MDGTSPAQTGCYQNRELSWLLFNERVLDEAGNTDVPLAERLTFASIYQSNLDEFFMVRVGTLMVQMLSGETIRDNKTNMTARDQVSAILDTVKSLEKKKTAIYTQLMDELAEHGVSLINFNTLSDDEGKILEAYFDKNIAPFLSPMIIGKQQPFPFLQNGELYAVVLLSNRNGKNRMGIVQCSNQIFKRLIEIPSRPGTFMLCEELILHCVTKLFSNYAVREKSVIRITRNADIEPTEVYDEDLDYRNFMEHLIKQRKRMSPVRLELSRQINESAKKELSGILEIDGSHIINAGTPLDLSFVFQIRDFIRSKKELFYRKRIPKKSPSIDVRKSIIPQIMKKDVLLSYPFESIKPFLNLLHEAAEDSSVVSIKMTLYRVADKSKIIDSLIEAAENGKEVVVLVELRARFDEENNIEMSRRLEEAGCRIIYGLGDYKVHSKLCLITRHTENGLSYITQIGTGNYNEKTSLLYTDLSLITADSRIGTDAAAVFKSLLLGETVDETDCLLVAPNCLQNRILQMIDEQIALAKTQGAPHKNAYIGIKINSLTDKVIIDKLVEASCAGVRIELCVRGICCLVPGIRGLTDNIKIVSIVGRFLEHSRIYIFGNPSAQDGSAGVSRDCRIFIGSADFMTRNTERRVEVAVPVFDDDIKNRLVHIFTTVMADNVKGRELTAEKIYVRRTVCDEEKRCFSQEQFYEEAYKAVSRRETQP
ncbi:polyphosphate kinase 1 [uncultured Treponema sp.]|uniref:polyphosphate kinase 1 n=1 Tax=uncultured Treponema sp. TaxID=162155 RepID=UPI002592775E|nr:polyphosphate kinase 1 [uncultured Treponema sp.]